MIPRLLLEIVAALNALGGNLRNSLNGISARLDAIGAEQVRQGAILEEIRAAVVSDQAASIQIVEGPPEEQP